jgi:hypothetical protein
LFRVTPASRRNRFDVAQANTESSGYHSNTIIAAIAQLPTEITLSNVTAHSPIPQVTPEDLIDHEKKPN